MQPKRFIAPAWILGIITVIRIVLLIAVMIEWNHYYGNKNDQYSNSLKISFVIPWLTMALLVAQVIAYWRLRYKIYQRKYAWLHIVLYSIAFILLPIITTTIPYLLDNYPFTQEPMKWMKLVSTINLYVFWICFIGGLVLLAIIIKKAVQKRSEMIQPVQSEDILSDL